ncbi:MAG: metallophosphoesterase family protein [Omnitrophica WOR_2 bacterium]
MKVLSVSDIQIPFLYSPQIVERLSGIDLAIDCGDLPYFYVEYILNALNIDLYFVRGNHSKEVEQTTGEIRRYPLGATDINGKIANDHGLLLAGVEGSLRYRQGPYQYSQTEMWYKVFALVPALMMNRIRFGRFLDVFITHAPPWGIHDRDDLPHQGIKAFRWLLQVFKPSYHFHGHIHIYHPDTVLETRFGSTLVINTFGYRVTDIQPPRPDHYLQNNTGRLDSLNT